MTNLSAIDAVSATTTDFAPGAPAVSSTLNDGLFASALTSASEQFSATPPAAGGLFVDYEGPTSSLGTGSAAPDVAPASPWLTLAASSLPAATTTAAAAASPLTASALSTSVTPSGPVTPPSTSASGSTVVATAEQYLGTPYLWGGTTPAGFDCSGFVQYVYARLGVSLPRTSEEQANVGQPVTSLAAARPGDLLFFAGSDGTPSSPGHVAIYVGGNQMIDAPYTGTTVRVEAIPNAGSIVAIRRVVGS